MGDKSPRTQNRLTTTEQELLDATREFSAGASEFGAVDALEDAVAAMELARDFLHAGKLPEGQAAESEAVADLVRARVNIRKMLSDSNSSSSSQCRTFDRQQAQKLRPPKKQDQQPEEEQLAEMREQVEQLAQQQRQWSEEVRSGSGGAKLEQEPSEPSKPSQPPPSQSANSSPSSQGQSSLTKPQLAASEAAQSLREQFNNSDTSSPLIEQQLSSAAKEIDDSVEKLAEGDRAAAASAAERAADQLDDVSAHLAALNAPDFAQQLGLAQRLAQRLASQQQSVAHAMQSATAKSNGDSKPQQASGRGRPGQAGRAPSAIGQQGSGPNAAGSSGSAVAPGIAGPVDEQQRELAAATDRLGEVLAHLAAKAWEEDQAIQDTLDNVRSANSPQDIADTMRDAAGEFEGGKLAEASRSADRAEASVRSLARGLGDARRQYTQPSLDDLIAAEAEAAELVDKSKDPQTRDLAEFRAKALERKLREMARRDRRLSDALQAMSQTASASSSAAQGGGSPNGQPSSVQEGEGLRRLPTVMGGPVNEVAKVLQERIQAVILDGVTSSSNEAVPLQYREMVERYYKNLSDDLR